MKMTDKIAEPNPKTRDRARTEEVIIAAARSVLADQGFQGFGINAIARQAGCDKQLLYRYYGGLDGLADAIGNDVANGLGQRLTEQAGEGVPDSYAGLIEKLVLGFIEVLRADSLLQRIIAWEISEPGPMVIRFASARSFVLRRWVEKQRGDLMPPPAIDAPAINAMLIAAAQHLVLSASSIGGFAGIDLVTDEDWSRIRASVRQLVRAVY
ncbi:MAG: TetR family transcriptional regulator [Sphingomonas sp. 28-62-20]|nr:MAG: TetR family transcriptional regulator [Sphingomonas sp. 28-62-20]